jgi:hypothetical protein
MNSGAKRTVGLALWGDQCGLLGVDFVDENNRNIISSLRKIERSFFIWVEANVDTGLSPEGVDSRNTHSMVLLGPD